MGIHTSFSRCVGYWRRHGLLATVRRAALSARRAVIAGRMIIFYCDLATPPRPRPDLPANIEVERIGEEGQLSRTDLEQMTSFWNPTLASRKIKERFVLGASLWIIRFEGQLAGYGWTLRGRSVEPHYFPLGQNDVQFFDFHVFPKYRGRAIDWCLMTHVLYAMSEEGASRAFGEAGEWNKASLSSFGMTKFQRLGRGRKITVFGRAFVIWSRTETARKMEKGTLTVPSIHPTKGRMPVTQ